MTKIVEKDAPVLRLIAKEVEASDIKTKKIQDILKKMKTALNKEDDGVAIAAPQIGESLRIFVVSGRAFGVINNKNPEEVDEHKYQDQVFINPKIVKLSKTKAKMEEGCLSIRWLYGQVERSTKATVRAFDEKGNKFEKGASGLLAQIFQHEVDHLDGILFTDKAENIDDIPPVKND